MQDDANTMRMLITAGPTREPIDAVRFISNRSSGMMGLALAEAGRDLGHHVTLLMGPGPQEKELPANVTTYRFNSSAELKQLLDAHFPSHDLLLMAAAVSDYRPAQVSEGKLPSDKQAGMTLHLAPTPDLVALMASQKRAHQRVIAFALEEAAHLRERALAKMARKHVDGIVANPLGTMESDQITGSLLLADGQVLQPSPPRCDKKHFAKWLIQTLDQPVKSQQ